MSSHNVLGKRGGPLVFDTITTRWIDCKDWTGTNQFIEFKINGRSLLDILGFSPDTFTTIPTNDDGLSSPFNLLLPDFDLIPYSKRVAIYLDSEDSAFEIGGGISVEVVFTEQCIIWQKFHFHSKYEPDEILVIGEAGPYSFEPQQFFLTISKVFEKS